MNDRVAIFQAMALQEVANDLHASLNSMSDPKTYKPTDEGTKRLFGYATSIAVLRALAVELTLKALALKRTGRCKKIHDLLKLYDSLGTDTQAIISRRKEGTHEGVSVRRILEKHKNDFVDWRYPLPRDGDKMHVKFSDIRLALDVLLLVYRSNDFLALCDR